MGKTVTVNVHQVSPSASKGIARSHEVLIDRPTIQDGEDKGPMGGELVLLGLGGCFMSTLLAAIRARNAAISNVNIYVAGVIDEQPGRFTAAQLTISAEFDDPDLMEKVVTIARRGCLVVNTLQHAMDLSFQIMEKSEQ